MKTYSIATIPGDGIGKEVVPAGRLVLETLAKTSKRFRFEFEDFDWGGDCLLYTSPSPRDLSTSRMPSSA